MTQQIIQVNFQLNNTSMADYHSTATAVSSLFAAIDGLQWKIWLVQKERMEAGGLYLFSDAGKARQYLESALFKQLSNDPRFIHFSVKQFDIMETPGLLTNAPVGAQLTIE